MTMASNEQSSNDASPQAPTATSAATASGCPVLARGGDVDTTSAAKPGIWGRLFSRSNESAALASNATPSPSVTSSISQCPVKGDKAIPASIENAANYAQTPAPGQRIPLSTSRVISSIPRGDNEEEAAIATTTNNNNKPTTVPAHQPPIAHNWQYPSEQQFYNAMLKKGYRPPVEAIPDTLRIHNAVNERSWTQLCKWEKDLHDNTDPKLVKFVGRPKDISPKAWLNSRILMTQEPFDRHDWYVEDLKGGEPRRYVIDFYEGKESVTGIKKDGMPLMKPPSMYIDVRPALDNPSAAVDRMAMCMREALPGLAGAYDSYKSSSSSAVSSNVASISEVVGKSNGESGKQ